MYNNLFIFLETVNEPWPTYACDQFMQGSSRGNNVKFNLLKYVFTQVQVIG